MHNALTWNDADEIGILLSHAHPELEPLAVHLPDLQRLVTELSEFTDDPSRSNDAKLKAIQEAWHAEFLDRTQG